MSTPDNREVGPFGKFLFGRQRGLPSRANFEPNTPEEQKVLNGLQAHYWNDLDSQNTQTAIRTLAQYKDHPAYAEFLRVPDKYPYAYRVMRTDRKTLSKIIGDHRLVDEIDSYTSNKPPMGDRLKRVTKDGLTISPLKGAIQMSWTASVKAFEKIARDWVTFSGYGTYLMFLRAEVAANNFLLNPDKTPKLGDGAQYWAAQKEIISIGTVKLKDLWVARVYPNPGDSLATFDGPYADHTKVDLPLAAKAHLKAARNLPKMVTAADMISAADAALPTT